MRFTTILVLPLFLTLASAGEKDQNLPKGCGEADLYDRDGTRGLLFGDNVCRQVTSDFRAATIFKGCDCTMYNGYACTHGDFEARADARDGELQITYLREMKLSWYMCLRRN